MAVPTAVNSKPNPILAGVPGSSFFHEPINHLVRFHFAKREETLVESGERLLRLKKL